MAFHTTPTKYEYRPDSRLKPCSVIVSYTAEGLVKPMYIKYQSAEEENITLKVDSVQPYTDLFYTISIVCLVIVGDRKVQVKIIYNKKDVRWNIVM